MNKSDFDQQDILLADLAKALSHPARIQILKILANMKSCMCGDIVKLLPLSQSTVSQHLKELKRVHLIQGEIEGPKVCYCINDKTLKEAVQLIQQLFSQLGEDNCKCT